MDIEKMDITNFTMKSQDTYFIKRDGCIGTDNDAQRYYRSAKVVEIGSTAFVVVDLESSDEKSRAMIQMSDIDEMTFDIK